MTSEQTSYLALNTYTKLMRAAETVTNRVSRTMAEAGLTISQFGVLEALHHKGPLCQRDVAAKILKSTGNITMVIDNLEKRELVTRERASEDRRYLTVNLTEKGRELISTVFGNVEAAIMNEVCVLTPVEQKTLGGLCKTLGLRNAGNRQE
ncbi:MAG: MarR family winged helix-turn-helix transcriptional regulator [Desulfuromonadaceae bacterium]|nr:MarR family winged helix-turn-helix transcriptional regulator [Desulfuromonadaceae bacterium]MDD5105873.1 MarR family winged helix-turn-helix transcriptional regulator [Desulfuromonadaceae bacterium]